MGMVAFVAGATGYTGREVVRELRHREIDVIAHVRPGSSAAVTWTPRFTEWGAVVVECPWGREQLDEIFREHNPTLVFSLLGTTRARAGKDGVGDSDIYDAVDRRLSEMLIEVATGGGGVTRFMFLSSLGAKARSSNRYLAARGRVEETLRDSGLPFTIARPSFISGQGRDKPRVGERVGAAVADSILTVAGVLGARGTRNRYRSIDNSGLAAALVEASMRPEFEGRTLLGEDLQALATR